MSLTKNPKAGLKVKGKSQKKQGDEAKTGSMSDDRQMPKATHPERGLGSEFANSVKAILEESKNQKGSEASFLGVDKQIIDPKQFAHSLVDKKKDK